MNHTTNYNLPQWEATDAVKREDMNGAMSGIDAALAGLGNCQIEYQQYVGTGTYGKDHPTRITFSKMPTVYIIFSSSSITVGSPAIYYGALVVYDSSVDGTVLYRAGPSWNGTTASFVSERTAENQMNFLNLPYGVVAFYAK